MAGQSAENRCLLNIHSFQGSGNFAEEKKKIGRGDACSGKLFSGLEMTPVLSAL